MIHSSGTLIEKLFSSLSMLCWPKESERQVDLICYPTPVFLALRERNGSGGL